MKEHTKILIKNNKVMYGYIALFVLACVYVGGLLYFSLVYQDKIYPGIKILGEEVGGKTKEEAIAIIEKKIAMVNRSQIILKASQGHVLLFSDLEIQYLPEETALEAFEIGRSQDYNPYKVYNRDLELSFSFNRKRLVNELITITSQENKLVEDAAILSQNTNLTVQPEKVGSRVLFGENLEAILQAVGQMEYEITLQSVDIFPQLKKEDIEIIQEKVSSMTSEPIVLKSSTTEYKILQKDLIGFLTVKSEKNSLENALNNLISFSPDGGIPTVEIARENILAWSTNFANNHQIRPTNLTLGFDNNKLTVKTPSVDGQEIEIQSLAEKIKTALSDIKKTVIIPFKAIKAQINEGNLSELGITTRISQGHSNYYGSPTNRIHNVKNGASKFNGILIKPQEVFSFNTVLGPVEAETGYLPELVILENKTVPQYGGGLCQVSSTAFRAALNAGFPILARSNHAYPVQYYRPYGVDATIYLPEPDLSFKNDSDTYVYVQTYSVGYELYFDFYGTKREGTIKFAGNKEGTYGASTVVENITPAIYDYGLRGTGSFTAAFWRFIYDKDNRLINMDSWVSKYDSPSKYPH